MAPSKCIYVFIYINWLIDFILHLVSGWDAAFSSFSMVSVGKPFHFFLHGQSFISVVL